MTRLCFILLSVLGLAFASGEAWAQSWPTRPIRAIVAFSAGGIVHVMARVVFGQLSTHLPPPVSLENPARRGTPVAPPLSPNAVPAVLTSPLQPPSCPINPSL